MNIGKESESRYKMQKEYSGGRKIINHSLPKVSVLVQTYQHRKFINQCLDGILMQETNFVFEIIVGEDESDDGTREICMDYANKYPDKIRLFLRDRKVSNLFDDNGNFLCRFNSRWNILSARGKYIALCDGDDYWTDPFKLQKQVDFLDSNPDYGLIFSDIKLIDSNGHEIKNHYTHQKNLKLYKSGIVFWDLIENNFINTLTVCGRRELFTNYFSDYSNEGYAYDLRYWLYFSLRSKIKYSEEKWANYRVHQGGMSRKKDFFKKRKPLVIQSAILDLLTLEDKKVTIDWRILSNQLYKLFINKNLSKKEKRLIINHLKGNPRYFVFIVIGFLNKVLFRIMGK